MQAHNNNCAFFNTCCMLLNTAIIEHSNGFETNFKFNISDGKQVPTALSCQ